MGVLFVARGGVGGSKSSRDDMTEGLKRNRIASPTTSYPRRPTTDAFVHPIYNLFCFFFFFCSLFNLLPNPKENTKETKQPTTAIMVKPGDSIPTVELEEGGPGNKVNLATEFADGNGLIIGVPAAFSTSRSTLPINPQTLFLLSPPHLSLSSNRFIPQAGKDISNG